MNQPKKIVVVGGGLAAVSAIETLRDQQEFDGEIVLLTEEAELPYDRPPLSKAYLKGEQATAELLFQNEAWFLEKRVMVELGAKATVLDASSRYVTLEDGRRVSYDKLLLATGSRARELAGPFSAANVPVSYLRTRRDADLLRELAVHGSHVVIVGGGVIGMEAAATLIGLGCQVTVVELADRIMGRFLHSDLSAWLSAVHERRGVRVHAGCVIESVTSTGGRGARIRLTDGATLDADWVLAGIGVIPNFELAATAGLTIRLNGIEVNDQAQTSSADIFAAGDVATFPHNGELTRWENWTHARNHAAVAAQAMLGQSATYSETPWVWSNQYEFNIQSTGTFLGDAHILRGNPSDGSFIFFHLYRGEVVGATAVNDNKSKAAIRKLVEARRYLSPDALRDPSTDLKKLAASFR